MKKVLFSIILSIPFLGVGQDTTFKVNAKISNVKDNAKAYLYYFVDGLNKLAAADVTDGKFEISVQISNPAEAWLYLAHQGEDFTPRVGPGTDRLVLYIEPGVLNLQAKDSVKNVDLSHSKLNKEYLKYQDFMGETRRKAQNIENEKRAFNRQINAKSAKLKEERDFIQKKYISDNPNSYLSLVALQEIGGHETNVLRTLDPVFNSLSDELRQTTLGKEISMKIQAAKSTVVGSVAIDFTQNDVNGKAVSLSDFRGKYVLLDFWASWCGPCRAENPNLVAAYNKYKDKNFEVLGVSLDKEDDRDAWIKAIATDGLNWVNVSDLNGWKNEAALLYNIRAVPTSFLISPDGKIVATNLRGKSLNDKLESIFGK